MSREYYDFGFILVTCIMDIYIYLPIFIKLHFFCKQVVIFLIFSYYTYARALNFIGSKQFLPILDNHC